MFSFWRPILPRIEIDAFSSDSYILAVHFTLWQWIIDKPKKAAFSAYHLRSLRSTLPTSSFRRKLFKETSSQKEFLTKELDFVIFAYVFKISYE